MKMLIQRSKTRHYNNQTRTIKQATLAPMATAPAVPPRMALAPAFCITSLKEGVGFFSSVLIRLILVR